MKLHAKARKSSVRSARILRVTSDAELTANRYDHVLAVDRIETFDWKTCKGFGAVLSIREGQAELPVDNVSGLESLAYLSDGDVIGVHPNGIVRVLYRKASQHNFLFITNNCNSLCLMCSQPPAIELEADRTEEILRLIDLIDPLTTHVGVTGGEPTFFPRGFLRIVEKCKAALPETALHVLSNGRYFSDPEFTKKLASIGHPRLTIGIPVYADVDSVHDHVVQVRGAFTQTVHGIYNLAEEGIRIEVRNVLSRLTVRRLGEWADFLARNMTFVSHVALMGLEMTGFVHRNFDELWVDPFDYREKLEAAVTTLIRAGLETSIYNHQLCLLPKGLWQYSVRSISDWKNIYLQDCEQCDVRTECGGFFQSGAKKHSRHITVITNTI